MKKQKKFLFKRPSKEKKYNKMYIYVIVVNYGFQKPIIDILQSNGSNVQYTALGRGTVTSEVANMLGLESNQKNVIFAMVDESNINDIKQSLEKRFAENKRERGMAFSVRLTSIVGEKIYSFLTNTL